MRVWPESQNGTGDVYFEFCPTRHTDWALDPGTTYRLKYRMLVYDGKIEKPVADRINDYEFLTTFLIPPKREVLLGMSKKTFLTTKYTKDTQSTQRKALYSSSLRPSCNSLVTFVVNGFRLFKHSLGMGVMC